MHCNYFDILLHLRHIQPTFTRYVKSEFVQNPSSVKGLNEYVKNDEGHI